MGLKSGPTEKTWRAPFEPLGVRYAALLGTGTHTVVISTDADAVLLQARSGNLYYRIDGQNANAYDFVMIAEDPPMLIPVTPNTDIRLTGAATTTRIIYQSVRVPR